MRTRENVSCYSRFGPADHFKSKWICAQCIIAAIYNAWQGDNFAFQSKMFFSIFFAIYIFFSHRIKYSRLPWVYCAVCSGALFLIFLFSNEIHLKLIFFIIPFKFHSCRVEFQHFKKMWFDQLQYIIVWLKEVAYFTTYFNNSIPNEPVMDV